MQPVPITRAEYEKRFGVKPVVQTDVDLDTTPAPVRITRAEYAAMFNPPEKTTTENIKQDVQETKQGISNTLAEGSQLRANTRDRFMQGEISAPKSIYQQGGQLIGTGFGVAFEALKGAAKTLLPEAAEKTATDFVKGFIEKGAAYNDRFVANAMENGTPEEKRAVQDILDTKKLYDTDPNFKADVDAALNIGSLITLPGTAKNVATKTVEATADLVDAAMPPAAKIVENIKQRVVPAQDKRVAAQAADILKVETKYQDGRNSNAREGAAADASRQRIAQSNVLEGAVDENGLIDTTEAVKIYRASTIDGDEGKVRELLKAEGNTVNLKEVRKELRLAVSDSGLEGAALEKAIKGIDNHIKGLARRADPFGNVPLFKIQDAKLAEYEGIDFKKKLTAKYKKTIARVYKEVIESKSGQDVRAINAELSKFYTDIERLERLNGKRVEGGRLGKYGAQVVGTALGAAGGSVAGPAGAFVVGAIGGELGASLKGKAMAGTFSRGIDGKAPDNSVLKGATLKVDLKTPSPKVGVPARVKATPEMRKVEAQIARNVDLQKKAIKAGDFGLVAELKDIYENLVAKLNTLLKEIVESAKNPTIGLSTKRVTDADTFTDLGRANKLAEGSKDGFLYHGTNEDVLENIMKEGLRPGRRGQLSVSTTEDYAKTFAREGVTPAGKTQSVLLRVKSDALVGKTTTKRSDGKQRPLPDQQNELLTKETIAPENLEIYNDGKWEPLIKNKLAEEAKKYKSAEEFVKAQGTPVYHGTLETFNDFDGKKAGSNTGWSNARFGTFFLDDATKAREFPELARVIGDDRPVNVKEVYIDLNNPLDLTLEGILTKREQAPTVYKILSGEDASPDEALAMLDDGIDLGTIGDLKDSLYGDIANKKIMQDAGFDGIVSDYGDGIIEKVVFDTNQIKTRTQLIDIWNKANGTKP
jgi:hypothetical protein